MAVNKPVKSCLCYAHTFEELKRMATSRGWSTVEEITAAVGCGSGCGLCRPYLLRMLETGETEFEIIAEET